MVDRWWVYGCSPYNYFKFSVYLKFSIIKCWKRKHGRNSQSINPWMTLSDHGYIPLFFILVSYPQLSSFYLLSLGIFLPQQLFLHERFTTSISSSSALGSLFPPPPLLSLHTQAALDLGSCNISGKDTSFKSGEIPLVPAYLIFSTYGCFRRRSRDHTRVQNCRTKGMPSVVGESVPSYQPVRALSHSKQCWMGTLGPQMADHRLPH